MNQKHTLAALLLAAAPLAAQAQTTPTGSVGIGTTTPNASAALDISSTNKGLLLPRLTLAQRTALTNSPTAPPVAGLVIYQSDNTPGLYAYDGAAWVRLGADNLGSHTATQNLNLAGNQLVGNGGSTGLSIGSTGNVGLGTTAAEPATQRLDVRGNVRLGENGVQAAGTGQAIEFVGPGVSSDPVGIYRFNPANDQSELRVVVGDTPDANDKFAVGRMPGTSNEGGIPTGSFTPTFSVNAAGQVSAPGLAGTGTRVVTADAAGNLGTATAAASAGDNLGNHTATQALNLAGQLLVGGTAAAPGTTGLAVDGAGKVGIGINTPLAALHLSEGTALFTAAGDVPATAAPLGVSGTGRRAFWYADKAAFRAGYAGGYYTHVILTAYPGGPNSGAEAAYVSGDGSTYFDEANVGPYSFASGYASLASGQGAVAMGTYNRASGLNSVSLGERTLASGDNSVAIGSEISVIGQGGVAIGRSVYSSAAFATAIGLQCLALAPYSMALGKNAWTRHQGAVTISDASASFSSDWVVSNGPNELNMRFVGGYYFNTSVNTRGSNCGSCGPITGVMLAPGGGSWTTLSDRRAKENFRPVDAEQVLGKLAALPVTEWNYKSQPASQHHIGPMAQDFYQAFRLDGIGRDTTINTGDIDGVNLVAIQALAARTARLQAENEQLRTQLAQQQTQLPGLETHTTTAEAQAAAAVARATAAATELRTVQTQTTQAAATLDTFEARLRVLEAAGGQARK